MFCGRSVSGGVVVGDCEWLVVGLGIGMVDEGSELVGMVIGEGEGLVLKM